MCMTIVCALCVGEQPQSSIVDVGVSPVVDDGTNLLADFDPDNIIGMAVGSSSNPTVSSTLGSSTPTKRTGNESKTVDLTRTRNLDSSLSPQSVLSPSRLSDQQQNNAGSSGGSGGENGTTTEAQAGPGKIRLKNENGILNKILLNKNSTSTNSLEDSYEHNIYKSTSKFSKTGDFAGSTTEEVRELEAHFLEDYNETNKEQYKRMLLMIMGAIIVAVDQGLFPRSAIFESALLWCFLIALDTFLLLFHFLICR